MNGFQPCFTGSDRIQVFRLIGQMIRNRKKTFLLSQMDDQLGHDSHTACRNVKVYDTNVHDKTKFASKNIQNVRGV